jgi:hypothetical protein
MSEIKFNLEAEGLYQALGMQGTDEEISSKMAAATTAVLFDAVIAKKNIINYIAKSIDKNFDAEQILWMATNFTLEMMKTADKKMRFPGHLTELLKSYGEETDKKGKSNNF